MDPKPEKSPSYSSRAFLQSLEPGEEVPPSAAIVGANKAASASTSSAVSTHTLATRPSSQGLLARPTRPPDSRYCPSNKVDRSYSPHQAPSRDSGGSSTNFLSDSSGSSAPRAENAAASAAAAAAGLTGELKTSAISATGSGSIRASTSTYSAAGAGAAATTTNDNAGAPVAAIHMPSATSITKTSCVTAHTSSGNNKTTSSSKNGTGPRTNSNEDDMTDSDESVSSSSWQAAPRVPESLCEIVWLNSYEGRPYH